jgi:NDP-sugar pyrophosphorylase family protein
MVLTAGLGTRLAPLSNLRAKPALPVAGVPLAGRILRWLAAAGVRQAVLNLHHLPESITAAIGDGEAFGVHVRYSWERTLLGGAGGPARALPLLGSERFLLVNGDSLTNLDLGSFAARHRASGAAVTLALVPNPDPRHYGGVSVDAGGRVTGFTAAGPANGGLHFIGVQAVEAGVFAAIDPDVPSDTINGVYRTMLTRAPGSIRAVTSSASFFDIGTAADYLDTCLVVARAEGLGDTLLGARTALAAGARVSRSVLWDDVCVEGGAVVDQCIVTDGARVPEGARLRRSVVTREPGREPGPDEAQLGDLIVSPLDARRRKPAQ